jgi:hypothetical protein
MVKTQTKNNKHPKTPPPSKGTQQRTSPRLKGSGTIQGRGGKTGSRVINGTPSSSSESEGGGQYKQQLGKYKQSSSSSESELDTNSNKKDKSNNGHHVEKVVSTDITTQDDLLNMLKEKERIIKRQQMEIDYMKNKTQGKKTIREFMNWSGEEINFSEDVNTFVREFLFTRYKFLKDGWQHYQSNKHDSLSSLCLRKLSLPDFAQKDDIWDRVIVPTIQSKYINIKGNMNNDLKKIYLSMMCFVKCDLKNVFY